MARPASTFLLYSVSERLLAPDLLILSSLFQVMMAHTPDPMNMKVPTKFQIGSSMLPWMYSLPSMTYPTMRTQLMTVKVTRVEFPRFSMSMLGSLLLSLRPVVAKKIVSIISMSVNNQSYEGED